jgi:hypothetical protein
METTLPKWLLAQRKGATRKAPRELNNFKGELSTPNPFIFHGTYRKKASKSLRIKYGFVKFTVMVK